MKYVWMLLLLILIGGLIATAQDSEATPEVTPEASSEVTEAAATPVPVSDLLGLSLEPPMTIALPETWSLLLRDTYLYRDLFEDGDGSFETVPIDVYGGPLSNNTTGWIVVVWGFDSIVTTSTTAEEFDERSAWLDGFRMLQLVVFPPGCLLGTAPQRSYTIGALPAVGTTFTAVDCPNALPDTRGWFASLKVDALNFAFYAYADPLQPMESTFEYEIQAILDTVVFHVDEIIVSQAEFEATRDAFIQTQIAPTPIP